MNRFATEPSAEDDERLNAEPERCETCGEDCVPEAYARTAGGTFAFCCESCFFQFVTELENGQ
jgi:hypothetical protein